jgi:hypothetical protein
MMSLVFVQHETLKINSTNVISSTILEHELMSIAYRNYFVPGFDSKWFMNMNYSVTRYENHDSRKLNTMHARKKDEQAGNASSGPNKLTLLEGLNERTLPNTYRKPTKKYSKNRLF